MLVQFANFDPMNIEWIRKFCLSLPAATEDVKWGHDLVFSIGGRMFCVTSLDGPFTCSFKVTDESFEEWSLTNGFKPAPYMARAKWVQVTEPGAIGKKQWELLLKESYELVKKKLTKKERESLGI